MTDTNPDAKCPGCKESLASYRQGKGREHLCGWCGYNHDTGEQAELVGASNIERSDDTMTDTTNIEGAFKYPVDYTATTYPVFERILPGTKTVTAPMNGPPLLFTFYSGEYVADKMTPGWIVGAGAHVACPRDAKFVSYRPALPGEEAALVGEFPAASVQAVNSKGTPIRRLSVTPEQGNAIIAFHKEAERTREIQGHNRPVDPADVLAYMVEAEGQEDDPEQALSFVYDAARMIADGKTYRDFGMSGYAGFVEWCDERHRQSFPLSFVYTNHRGETAARTVSPIRIYHGSTEWHPEPQWLLEAVCHDRKEVRAFPLSGLRFSTGALEWAHPVTGERLTAVPPFDVSAAGEIMQHSPVTAWLYVNVDRDVDSILSIVRWPAYVPPASEPDRVSRFREYPLYAKTGG